MPFLYTGKKTTNLYRSITLFFLYLGCMTAEVVRHRQAIFWQKALLQTVYSGAAMVFPLMVACILLGVSLTLSIHYLLIGFKLHNQAMHLVQGMLIRDFSPLPVGFILCVQCGLNLIETHPNFLELSSEKIILNYIIPLIIGVICTALFLYAYVFFSFFIGIFLTSFYFLNMTVQEYWLQLYDSIYFTDIVNSLAQTILYASVAGIIAGYYYFDLASMYRQSTIRTAVSRIITRGLFWLVVINVLLKL